jgi:NAD(P)-dependent dehydrogenase (short-subunit alcohol dehydrogenase family)
MKAGQFAGRVVAISGACGGFGCALARRFAAEGARLILSDIDAARLEPLVSELDGTAEGVSGDIARSDTSKTIVATALAKFGRLDVAINNAGIAHGLKRLAEIGDEEAERVVAIDLMAVFFAMKHQIARMEAQFAETGEGGTIVNLASVAGVIGAPGLSIYAAAKHGVVGLTKTAALESARRGVRINAVCPSYARTAMVTDTIMRAVSEADAKAVDDKSLSRGIPMGRLAQVEEVVDMVLFAASPASGFMTGQTLMVDGGLTAG